MKNLYVFNQLFAEPSFFEGMSRVLDLGTTLQEYNVSKTERDADVKALRNDWRAIGQDLNSSIDEYGQGAKKSI